jgi:hypothetical protein
VCGRMWVYKFDSESESVVARGSDYECECNCV